MTGIARAPVPVCTGEDQTGERLFDVSIEGEQVLSEYDIYAEAGGSLTAIQETVSVEVTDGELNVAFSTIEDNAKVSAIEIEPADGDGDSNAAPTIDSISDQTVAEGDTAQVGVNADDADGDALTLSVDGPSFVSLTDNGDGTGTLDIAPQSGDASTYAVDVTADDGEAQTTESFTLTVEESTASGAGSAEISVTENGGIDASTFGGGSFEVTNTGDQQLSSVQFDVSESLITDAMFDPDGTAGDETAKELSIDSESGDGVFTEDDSATATIAIEAADEPTDQAEYTLDEISQAKYGYDFAELSTETSGQVQAIYNRQPFPEGTTPADVRTREEIANDRYGRDFTDLSRETTIEIQDDYDAQFDDSESE